MGTTASQGLAGSHLTNSNSHVAGKLIRQLLTLLIHEGNSGQRGNFVEGKHRQVEKREKIKVWRNKGKMSCFPLPFLVPIHGLS